MSGRGKRRSRSRKGPEVVRGNRYLRPRLPDGSLGKVVPVEFYPRFSTVVMGDGAHQDVFDVSAFRRVSIPKGRQLTIEIVTTDDADRGWGGLPNRRRRCAAARSGLRRRAGKTGPIRVEDPRVGTVAWSFD